MGFFDSLTVPNQTTSTAPNTSSGTGFFGNLTVPVGEDLKKAQIATDNYKMQQAAVAAQPTIGSVARGAMTDIVDHVKSYANESAAIVPKFGEALLHPINTLSRIGNKVIGAEQSGVNQAGEGLAQVVQDPGAANKVAGVAKLISGLAGAAFSPVTGIFDVAEATPGLKQVADTINIPFTTTGKFGSWLTGNVIDGISNKYPTVLPPASRDIIKAPLQAVASLAGQILLGGKIMEGVQGFAEKGEVITPEVAKGIVVNAHNELAKVAEPAPVEAPVTPNATKGGFLDSLKTPEDISRNTNKQITQETVDDTMSGNREVHRLNNPQALQRAIDYNDLPSDTTPQTPLTVYRVGTGEINAGDHISLTKEGAEKYLGNREGASVIEATVPAESLVRGQGTGNEFVYAPKEAMIQSAEAKPFEAPTIKTSKLASDIAENLKKSGIEPNASELATYKTEDNFMKNQADRALKLITESPDQAKRIAMGEEQAPLGLKNESVYKALGEKAKAEGDTQTILDLAKSKVATEASIKGQDIKALDVGDHSNDPVKIIKDINESREKSLEKRSGKTKSKATDEIVKEIKSKKVPVTKQTWGDFIESIKCNY